MSDKTIPEKPASTLIPQDGHTLAYFTLGDPDLPCILLVHGLAANGLQFVDDAQYFARNGYFVIVPDLRGHGRSAFPSNVKASDFTIEKLTSDLLAILDAHGITKVNWVGNSLGGILALNVMRRQPERLEKVVIFGTAFALSIHPWMAALVRLSYKTLGKSLIAKIGARGTSNNKQAQDVVREMLVDVNVEPVSFLSRELSTYDFTQDALTFTKPILMLRGDGDKQVNAANASILPQFEPASQFQLIDLGDAGHCANLDQPELFRMHITNFLLPEHFIESEGVAKN